MTAQRLVENSVLTNQTAVVDEMLKENLLSEEYIYPFKGDVMEWWLIDDWLAEQLKAENQVIIEEYGCCWVNIRSNSSCKWISRYLPLCADRMI